MLRTNALYVERDSVPVLRSVSIEVQKGEFVCILGANCAGKSTLLSAVMGLLRPSRGSIYFKDRDITLLPTYVRVKSGLALVPATRELFWDLTVEENLKNSARFREEAERCVDDSLQTVYELFPVLKERKKQRARSLSGGEQQMLAIARALMLRPELLLLDEPSTGLAPHVAVRVFEVLKELHRKGVTILLVEQNVFNALELAERGYVMENGSVILEGKAETLLTHPLVKTAYLGM